MPSGVRLIEFGWGEAVEGEVHAHSRIRLRVVVQMKYHTCDWLIELAAPNRHWHTQE